MQWSRVLGNTGVIETPGALIPYYALPEGELILFDSGARKLPGLLAELEARSLRVPAVACTHLHPDHIANNRALITRYGTEIFADEKEIPSLKNWEPSPYPVTPLPAGGVLTLRGAEFHILPLPGHSPGHTAYVTPDGVCCLGDALMSADMLRKSKLPYMEDVDTAIASMGALRKTAYPFYIAAHQGVVPLPELRELITENIQKELDVYDLLRSLITGPVPAEELVTALIRASGAREILWSADFMRISARARVDALIRAGEVLLRNGTVYPVNN